MQLVHNMTPHIYTYMYHRRIQTNDFEEYCVSYMYRNSCNILVQDSFWVGEGDLDRKQRCVNFKLQLMYM